jgi:hypothetical protein
MQLHSIMVEYLCIQGKILIQENSTLYPQGEVIQVTGKTDSLFQWLLGFNIRFIYVRFNINVRGIVRGRKLQDSSQYIGENESISKPSLKFLCIFVNIICICVNLLKSIRRLVSHSL